MKQISDNQRIINIINRAIDLGFEFDADEYMNVIASEAEDFLIRTVGVEEYSKADVSFGRNESLYWSDGFGWSIESSGELVNSDMRDRSYFKLEDGKRVNVEWFELPDDEDDPAWENVCLDVTTVVDSEAKVICLYA